MAHVGLTFSVHGLSGPGMAVWLWGLGPGPRADYGYTILSCLGFRV